jgi:hypothetical protein
MTLKFNVVFEEKEGVHVATCLEMGLVATSDNADDLTAIMDKLIHRQLQFAIENENFQDIFHPADSEVWQRLSRAIVKEKAREVRKSEECVTSNNWQKGVAWTQTAYAIAC